MLIGIPPEISPDLMKIMMEMGHGDEIVLADGNFPAASNTSRLIRCDGLSIPIVLDAILQFFPLDYAVEYPVSLMAVTAGNPYKPEVWNSYSSIVKKHDASVKGFEYMERFDFYERARKAYAIVATSERSRFANIILKKGIVKE